MTRNAVEPRIVYAGNGVVDEFFIGDDTAEPIPFSQDSDIVIQERDADGVITLLEEESGYIISETESGHIATRVAGALPSGYKWSIRRDTDLSQESDVSTIGSWTAARVTVAETFDRLVEQIQDVDSRAMQGLRLDDFDVAYDGGGKQIRDIAAGTIASDAATYGQLQAVIVDAITNFSIGGLDPLVSIDMANDRLIIYDWSAGLHKSLTPNAWLDLFDLQPASANLDSWAAVSPASYYTSSQVNALAAQIVPVGVMFDWPGTTAPTGWLFCYGQAISRVTYSVLFAVIGTTFGAGDGSLTFNLPDARGRVIAGRDDMGGAAANRLTGLSGGVAGTLGAVGGGESDTLTVAELPIVDMDSFMADPTHRHSFSGPVNNGNVQSGGGENVSDILSAGNTAFVATGITFTAFGSGEAHNNVQPTLVLNKIIYTGVA